MLKYCLIAVLGLFVCAQISAQRTLVTDKIKMDGKTIDGIADSGDLSANDSTDLVTERAVNQALLNALQKTLGGTTTGFDLQGQFALGQSAGADSVYYLYNTTGSDVGGGILASFPKVGVTGKTGSNFWMDFVYPGTTEAFKYWYFRGGNYESLAVFSSTGLNVSTREDRGGAFLTNFFLNETGMRLRGGDVGFSPGYGSANYVYMPNEQTVLDSALYLWYPDGSGRWLDPATLGGGGGVISVNGETGAVTLTTDDIDDTGQLHQFATAAQLAKIDGVESGATADQSDAEIATAYANEVAQVSAGEIAAGTETGIRRFSPADVKSFVDTWAPAADGYLPDDLAAGNKTISSGVNILRFQNNAGSYSEISNSGFSVVGNAGSSGAGLDHTGWSVNHGNHSAYYEASSGNAANEGMFITTIADGDSAQVVVQADSDSENPVVRVRRRMTTGDYPTAGTFLGRFMGYGYGGNTQIQSYGSGAGLRLRATENFTATAGATAVDVVVDQSGTAGQLVAATFGDDGTLDMKGHSVTNSPSVITALHTYAPSTSSLTIDIQGSHKSVERVDLSSAGSPLTLTINNLFGNSSAVGFYTFHFTSGSSVDVVFPAYCLKFSDGTTVGTQTFSNGQVSGYYDGTNLWLEI